MLLLNIDRKVLWGFIGASAFDIRELERFMSRSLRFQRLISRKGAELGHVLLLDTNSLTAPSHFYLG